MIAAFAVEQGWRTLADAPVEDPDRGGMVVANLEKRWRDLVARADVRRKAGLSIEAAGRRPLAGPRPIGEILEGSA